MFKFFKKLFSGEKVLFKHKNVEVIKTRDGLKIITPEQLDEYEYTYYLQKGLERIKFKR